MPSPYRDRSWIDPRIEIRSSPIEGNGMFARQPIRQGEVVIIWGGALYTKAEVMAGKARRHSVVEVGEDVYMGDPAEEPAAPDDFMNHSCDPNLWFLDEVTLSARRDIAAGEEVTADYAMWTTDQDWLRGLDCRCGSAVCRRVVTCADWQRIDLQERYAGHFSPFINRRIDALPLLGDPSAGRQVVMEAHNGL